MYVNRLEIFFETCEPLSCKNIEIGLLRNVEQRDNADECDIIPITCVQRSSKGCMYHGVVDLENIAIPENKTTPRLIAISREN